MILACKQSSAHPRTDDKMFKGNLKLIKPAAKERHLFAPELRWMTLCARALGQVGYALAPPVGRCVKPRS